MQSKLLEFDESYHLAFRYDCCRLAQGVPMVKPFANFREKILEGCFPKLTTSASSQVYPPRRNNSYWRDIHRGKTNVEVADMEMWRTRILDAIDIGYMIDVS